MCKCTPMIRTPFCGRGDCLPPANPEPTETLFAQSVLAEFDRRDQAERLDAWERGLDQYAHRSDSSGYAGRMGLEVLTELRLTRAQADALAAALEELQATVRVTCEGGQVNIPGLEILGEALDEADAALRAYREANHG